MAGRANLAAMSTLPTQPEPQKEVKAEKVVVQPATDWRKLRLWQIQPIRDAMIVAGLFGILYLGYLCSIVTVPMLLALLLAYLFEPLVAWATRRFKWLSREGAAVTIIVAAGVLIVVPLIIGAAFAVVQGTALVRSTVDNTTLLVTSMQGETPEIRAEARASLPRPLQGASDWLAELRREAEEYRARRQEKLAPVPPDLPVPETEELTPELGPEVVEAPETVSSFPTWKENLYSTIESASTWIRDNAGALTKSIGQQAIGTGAAALAVIVAGIQRATYLVFVGFLTAFFFFFFCTGYGRVLEFWEDLIPERKKHRVIDLVRQMDRVVAAFVRGRLTICFILAGFLTVAYWVIGVPSPLLLGPMVGLLFIVPYVNVIGVPIAIFLMAIQPGSAGWQQQWWWIVFAPIGVYMIAQLFDDWVLSPMIQGKNTGMETPTILFVSFAGGALAGVYGLLLAIPVAACLRILLREVFWPKFRAWGKGKERDFLPISREG